MSWAVRRSLGREAHPLVDYVLLAEFDIDSGSTLKHHFPADLPDNKTPDWFAEHMLPEGAHNREVDCTYLFLNRDGVFVDFNSVTNHKDEAQHASGPPVEGVKYFLYGYNLVKTKYDVSVRRGAVMKSLCLLSRYSFVDSLHPLIDTALEEYFSSPSAMILEQLYTRLNSVDLSSFPLPSLQERLLMRRAVRPLLHYETQSVCLEHSPEHWRRPLPSPLNDCEVDLWRTGDEVGGRFHFSLSRLLLLMGEHLSRLYSALLLQQRVLFVGYGQSTRSIAELVLSTVSLIAPPLSGVLRRVFPYATLADLSFLEIKGYIAGVTNPMFQQRDSWWDVMIIIEGETASIVTNDEREKEKEKERDKERDRENRERENKERENREHSETQTPSVSVLSLERDSSVSSTSGERGGDKEEEREREGREKETDKQLIQSLVATQSSARPSSPHYLRTSFLDLSCLLLLCLQDKSLLLHMSRLEEKVKRLVEANLSRLSLLERENREWREVPRHPWEHLSVSLLSSLPLSPDDSLLSSSVCESELLLQQTLQREYPSSVLLSLAQTPSFWVSLRTKLLRLRLDAQTAQPRDLETQMVYAQRLFAPRGHTSSEAQEDALVALLNLFPEVHGGLTPLAAALLCTSAVVRYCAFCLLEALETHPATRPAVLCLSRPLNQRRLRLRQQLESGRLFQEIQEALRLSVSNPLTGTGTGSGSRFRAGSVTPPPSTVSTQHSPVSLSVAAELALEG